MHYILENEANPQYCILRWLRWEHCSYIKVRTGRVIFKSMLIKCFLLDATSQRRNYNIYEYKNLLLIMIVSSLKRKNPNMAYAWAVFHLGGRGGICPHRLEKLIHCIHLCPPFILETLSLPPLAIFSVCNTDGYWCTGCADLRRACRVADNTHMATGETSHGIWQLAMWRCGPSHGVWRLTMRMCGPSHGIWCLALPTCRLTHDVW